MTMKYIHKTTTLLPVFGAFVIAIILIAAPITNAAPDANLILHWSLNEGSGSNALDDSGNAYDGTIYNGAPYVAGHEGSGVSLNGIDQYIQTPTPFGFLGTIDQEYALSAWVKLPQTGQSGNIFHMSSAMDGSGWCIPFLTLTNGHFVATGWDQGGEVTAQDPALAASDQWYQVISTWDATNGLRLLVDGVLVASTPQSEYSASGSPMYASLGIGASSCSNDQGYLKGVVDDARIYSRALTSTDVAAIVSEGQPPVIAPVGQPIVGGPLVPGAPNTGVHPERDSFIPAIVVASVILIAPVVVLVRRILK